jgi:hypothetical protein
MQIMSEIVFAVLESASFIIPGAAPSVRIEAVSLVLAEAAFSIKPEAVSLVELKPVS